MTSPVDLGILLGLAYQTFTDELRADLETRGFSDLGGAYGYVFRALAAEVLNLNELATRLGMTAQGAVSLPAAAPRWRPLAASTPPMNGACARSSAKTP